VSGGQRKCAAGKLSMLHSATGVDGGLCLGHGMLRKCMTQLSRAPVQRQNLASSSQLQTSNLHRAHQLMHPACKHSGRRRIATSTCCKMCIGEARLMQGGGRIRSLQHGAAGLMLPRQTAACHRKNLWSERRSCWSQPTTAVTRQLWRCQGRATHVHGGHSAQSAMVCTAGTARGHGHTCRPAACHRFRKLCTAPRRLARGRRKQGRQHSMLLGITLLPCHNSQSRPRYQRGDLALHPAGPNRVRSNAS
jgi:hypothetical protein